MWWWRLRNALRLLLRLRRTRTLRAGPRRRLALDTRRSLLDSLGLGRRCDRRILKRRRGLRLLTGERQVACERRIGRRAACVAAVTCGECDDSEREDA